MTAAGDRATLFAPGDEVYYTGSIARKGTDAQFHVVDERIVGHKPRTLSFPEAAALALTTIVAWEALFARFRLSPETAGTLLTLGAAGGAGSMVTRAARQTGPATRSSASCLTSCGAIPATARGLTIRGRQARTTSWSRCGSGSAATSFPS